MDTGPGMLKAGWYYLSIEIQSIGEDLQGSKIYYDYGRGFNEEDTWLLPKVKDGRIETLIKFPWDLFHLRFDPCNNDHCTFKVGQVTLTKISKFKAFFIALRNYRINYSRKKTYWGMAGELVTAFFNAGKEELKKRMKKAVKEAEPVLNSSPYYAWYSHHDLIKPEDVDAMKKYIPTFQRLPLFSIIMPVYNPPTHFLKKAINSVLNQAYDNWELCIADDCSTDPATKRILQEYEQKDPRIKVVYRTVNGHISEASNSAVNIAKGEYLVLLDNDDELAVHALFMVAHAINRNRDAALIYSDEDKINENGSRFDPYFKPDFNKDLFLSQNMISHLGVYKTDIVRKIGGFRKGFEGSQDYDLALRFIEQINPSAIVHIPHILYHWRAIEGSTAVAVDNKGYAYDAGLKALEEHLQRTGDNGYVEKNQNNSYRIKRSTQDKPRASIIIPTRDNAKVLSICVSSILEKTSYPNYEILIMDNNSEEQETFDYFDSLLNEHGDKVRVIEYKNNFNFSAIVNKGVDLSTGDIVVLLNNDTSVINEEWLDEMVSQSLREDVGAVGAKLYYPDNHIQHAGVFLYDGHPGIHIFARRFREDDGYFNQLRLLRSYIAVSAACLAVRKSVYLAVRGFDEEHLPVAYNDVDFCIRLTELGYRNVWTPFAELYHYESLSRGNDLDEKNIARFKKEHSYMLQKWEKVIRHDPHFNHNLSCDTIHTQYSYPPRIKYPWKTI
jgi:glycosyltransferase involved in cell wall biosynthesis